MPILKKPPYSERMKNLMEEEEIIQYAMRYGMKEIRHPANIEEGVLPGQKMLREQIYRELGTTKKEFELGVLKLINTGEKKEFAVYRQELKKKIREGLKDNAEKYLGEVFDSDKHEMKANEKARLALDILKATDREYNQTVSSPVTINLGELPLGEGLEEAQRRLILELGITQDIFSQIENE